MSQLPELVEYVAQKVGKVPNLPHRNRSTGEGVTIDKDELARNSRRIEEMFAEDIALYGDYM